MEDPTARDYWKPGINVLFDRGGLDFTGTDYGVLRKVADGFVADDALMGCDKIAVVMKSAADFGVGRQFELLADERGCAGVRIFPDEQQAVRWLES